MNNAAQRGGGRGRGRGRGGTAPSAQIQPNLPCIHGDAHRNPVLRYSHTSYCWEWHRNGRESHRLDP